MADYPFKADSMEREWRFTLTDPIWSVTRARFGCASPQTARGGGADCGTADQISIQTMPTMLMGYKRPDYLAKIGRLNADEATIDMLEDTIEQQAPYISDYF